MTVLDNRRATAGPLPRPHQQEALDGLTATFAVHDRAQLVMACGSGKTYVGAWHASDCDADVVVVLTPSLSLVAQTAAAWRQVHPDAHMLLVCSDESTAAGLEERAAGDPLRGRPDVTTAPDTVARHFDRRRPGTLTVVIGTYHSAGVVAAALDLADSEPRVDLLVCDEAHQLAGRVSDAFAVALRDSRLPAGRRLFMTATPVRLGNLASDAGLDELEQLDGRRMLSMDDTETFGPVAYRLSAGEAISRGLLADYRVLVVAGHANSDAEDIAVQALVDAVRRHRVTRILTFHNRVAAARRFAARVQAIGDVDGVPLHATAVDGTMPTAQIRRSLGRLAEPAAHARITVVASAKVLREGVDVPAVDAVLFADPRSSNVEIVQAVGRALRLHPGKQRGTIVVPLPLTPDQDDDEQLAASSFGHIWRVLRGLRAHDDRIAAQLDEASRRWNDSTAGAAPHWLDVTGVDPADLDSLVMRVVRGTSTLWEHWYGLLQHEADRLGSAARIRTSDVVHGRKLGVWVATQRWLQVRGLLHPDRAARLEQVPGWSWSSSAAADQRTLDNLRTLAARDGTVAERDAEPSRYAGMHSGDRRPLGFWLARARQKHRDGLLDRLLVEELEQLPGWTWEPLTPADRAGIEALRAFVTWEGHTDVPPGHRERDVDLHAWVAATRRRRLLEQLPPAVRDEVLVVSPLDAKGSPVWAWDVPGEKWRLGADALAAYVARTGTAYPMPSGHREDVDGSSVALYQWCATQRMYHSRGDLEPARARWLAAQPGWIWRAPGVTRTAGEPIDLGGHPHGTAKGAASHCPCQPCLDYTRRFGRQSIERHRQRPDGVPSAKVRPHLQLVQDDIDRLTADRRREFERPPGASAIATAADVPLGDVRDCLAGKDVWLLPQHATALLNLTAQQVLDLFDTVGSRGRLTMSCEQLVDAAPTRALLEDLVARGWNARWIARELGYRQLAVKMNSELVSRRVAAQVKALHARVGNLVAPKVAKSERLPPLDEWMSTLGDVVQPVAPGEARP